jgi:hypothetical protein
LDKLDIRILDALQMDGALTSVRVASMIGEFAKLILQLPMVLPMCKSIWQD